MNMIIKDSKIKYNYLSYWELIFCLFGPTNEIVSNEHICAWLDQTNKEFRTVGFVTSRERKWIWKSMFSQYLWSVYVAREVDNIAGSHNRKLLIHAQARALTRSHNKQPNS